MPRMLSQAISHSAVRLGFCDHVGIWLVGCALSLNSLRSFKSERFRYCVAGCHSLRTLPFVTSSSVGT
jgi:hypothetical protein